MWFLVFGVLDFVLEHFHYCAVSSLLNDGPIAPNISSSYTLMTQNDTSLQANDIESEVQWIKIKIFLKKIIASWLIGRKLGKNVATIK